MSKVYMKCTFKNDIVLLGSSNTEGKSEVLDFIPGSNFVGIVAKMINDKKLILDFEKLMDGSIRFGEATLLKDSKLTYKIPFSYFKPKKKSDGEKIYNHHHITEDEHKDKQMKQIRSGYIADENSTVIYPEYDYQQKSSYNKDERRSGSDDSDMFGYPAIVAGTKWIFTISVDDENIKSEIVTLFCETTQHYLGKSKTAQYGKVAFEKVEYENEIEQNKRTGDTPILLYAKSRLALYDPKTGEPTFKPTIENLGLMIGCGNIDWENTQIRTTTFAPYNGAQKNRTSERIVIEKGSVIALENVDNISSDDFKCPIGAYQNEGFGEILVNPSFLDDKNPEIKFEKDSDQYDGCKERNEENNEDDHLLKYLASKKSKKDSYFDLVEKVDKFIEDHPTKYKNLNSQWGVIRSFVSNPHMKNIVEEVKNYTLKGKMKSTWDEQKRRETLIDYIETIDGKKRDDFVKLLAMRMQSKGGV